jgi:hypothetical protein
VGPVDHHLAADPRAADQARELNCDVDKSAAVITQVEHEFGRARGLQRCEGVVERGGRWAYKIAEEQIPDPSAVYLDDLGERNRRYGRETLGHYGLLSRAARFDEVNRRGLPDYVGTEGGCQRPVRDQRGDRLPVDPHDSIAAL